MTPDYKLGRADMLEEILDVLSTVPHCKTAYKSLLPLARVEKMYHEQDMGAVVPAPATLKKSVMEFVGFFGFMMITGFIFLYLLPAI